MLSKMTQPIREPLQRRKSLGPMSPNAAKRLYRNLSFRLKGGSSSDESCLIKKIEKERSKKSSALNIHYDSIFDAVEHEDLDAVQRILGQAGTQDDLNEVTSNGLVPLDIAVLTNNISMASLLMNAGARDNHQFNEGNWDMHLTTLVSKAGQKVTELTELRAEASEADFHTKNRELRTWKFRQKLYKQMKAVFENAAEWSHSETFESRVGVAIVEDLKKLQYAIEGLNTGSLYYVRVSAYNAKGWGPPKVSTPPCATPSSWKECSQVKLRQKDQSQAVQQLLDQVKAPRHRSFFLETCTVHTPSKKLSVSRSLKYLFQTTNKFVKTLQRGVYLAAIFFYKENILVTSEDQIPIVEIDSSCSGSDMQEFLWFSKLSCMWKDTQWLQQGMNSALSSSSSVLQTRQKMLLAVSQLQGALGTQDLGQVHFEPIKDKLGNVLILTIKELRPSQVLENVRWIALSKLHNYRKSVSAFESFTALDQLFMTLKDKMDYHLRVNQALPPGLYLGYLKLFSSVDQIKVLVPYRVPNILCHTKIRDNKNVSREEWEWLRNVSSPTDSTATEGNGGCSVYSFLEGLRTAVKTLLQQLDVPLGQAMDFRLYTQEVLEFGEAVSFLLLLPPSDDVCSAPGQDGHPSGFLTLPLQIFELVHFCTYEQELFAKYCQTSILLELDSLLSQQALREAIDNTELIEAKGKHSQVADLIQQLDDIWREVRWITDVLQYARYRQPPTGTPLCWILEMSSIVGVNEKPEPVTDHLNSTACSPGYGRKKEPSVCKETTDEDDVFWPMERDCDSELSLSSDQLDSVGPQSDEHHHSETSFAMETDNPNPRWHFDLHRVQHKHKGADKGFHRTGSLEFTERTLKEGNPCKFWSQPGSMDEGTAESDQEGSYSFSSEIVQHISLPGCSLVEWIKTSQET
ncbi:ankyrin repeat and fibronectin type-III domain-containing protein 1-like isoform X2 [Scyliorhinus canicula]|uniref:ankyrin repeat and fibronectin type-III domain-containing protein 1-like isoform X2 n=1 Tax=Scyliorhinus canicula TaxID=7830 RepID=UPI0018F50554|nr:ankyrin repeat and fibronectin type-III domain-containing protein 1-like isoform X2 [Scyliorhinus canicula]